MSVETRPPASAVPDLTKGPAPEEPDVPTGMVEMVLKDKLDGNLSGYCIDIVGGGPNIDPANGLQAHTCYSYRGSLGSDQVVDPVLLSEGTIKIAAFDVCATIPSADVGTRIGLEACNGGAAQDFIMAENGVISPARNPAMCFTAGEETTFGRNGTSPHQIKSLTLEACDPELAQRQEWRTRAQED